ncbi:PREDICTED: uncharacterized protein LOC18592796 isoform X2 [Theobroma cacao]|uniref:Uncharacterized protein LOC18592796 isoform X2 n=1 Tax=Theobroma cacao TaxID=3641 RepID=A0AB32WR62_THECC|nr:PREDICTED: uncharacterized protein LOC18592796 isoform X2 [Theobroma cacao]
MEEYLEFMKTLRSQINDVEDQGSKISAQGQMHFTTIQTLQDDIVSVKSQAKQLREDTEQMVKAKGQICSEIIGKQRKIASLESDSSTLTQTLELIQQEKLSLSSKLMEKSTYYSKVAKDLSTKLQQQQVNNELDGQRTESEGKCGIENHPIMDYVNNEADNDLIVKLDLAKAKLDGIVQMKAKLVTDNGKIKESIEEAKCRANNFKPEVLEMSTDALEEEYKVLLSEKDGETEYLCSLQNQVERMKGISNVIKCACGEEYTVKLHA